ncbi:Peroxide stress-activated histidine kinase mak1 [Wickerhamomyces ciferrii]|uniref:Peroxide stress-activated histidine kinase mak1 n=1 Tax=Wickerhamomyces ciferrii (strain ATCC 14091 / BCRC 22168 / CBS 111 / JCM 3599 / NBRC 0793 / NRRL Y-1031 F-60-10) TaxID=1206466 RepID=K0K9R5_WICCF|nr:Peroxide stress-activated histidine kinase mak1 [Wickerhamomyces ciferrii]CCH41665.1 Peroxide stress-activated histidine kinase mak1 [Wickerhamomyces ciferrii]
MNAILNQNFNTPPSSPLLQPRSSSPKSNTSRLNEQEELLSRQHLDIDSLKDYTSCSMNGSTHTTNQTNHNLQLPSPLSPNSNPTDFFTLSKSEVQYNNSTSSLIDIPNDLKLHHDEEFNFLCVDDNQINLTILNKILSKTFNQASLKSTLNPLEVIGELHSKIYDVLFLDIEMPELNGVQIATMIRSIPFFNSLTIIAVTSRSSPQDLVDYTNAGIDYTIPKPITIDSSDFKTIVLNTMKQRR